MFLLAYTLPLLNVHADTRFDEPTGSQKTQVLEPPEDTHYTMFTGDTAVDCVSKECGSPGIPPRSVPVHPSARHTLHLCLTPSGMMHWGSTELRRRVLWGTLVLTLGASIYMHQCFCGPWRRGEPPCTAQPAVSPPRRSAGPGPPPVPWPTQQLCEDPMSHGARVLQALHQPALERTPACSPSAYVTFELAELHLQDLRATRGPLRPPGSSQLAGGRT